jgi:histidyl-tRNA synthetase
MNLIEPRLLKGFRDFLPEDMILRQKVISIIRNVFELHGFLPLETPTLEHLEILSGKYGEEGEKLIYKFKDQGERDVAMRYDLTVPLARVIAQYPNLSSPFRRYQIQPVWRADKPQKGYNRRRRYNGRSGNNLRRLLLSQSTRFSKILYKDKSSRSIERPSILFRA